MAPRTKYDVVSEIAKRRGFYWPSFEIYGGMSGFVTYGDLGTKLKRNIEALWKEHFVRRQGFLEIDDPVINPERVFQASGHLENFKEHSSMCTKCGKSFRADHLIEEKTGMENVEAMGGEAIKSLMVDHKIKCPNCGGQLKEPTLILTMFKTEIGATGGEIGYARPETAQAMFMNYKRAFQHNREKLPFALAQASKVLRNEISPRQGMIRLREFTIMELELFFDPEDPACPWFSEVKDITINLYTEKMMENDIKEPLVITISEAVEKGLILTEWQGYFMGVSHQFIQAIGVPPEKQRYRAHLPDERAHYSLQTYDQEVQLETWGWIEMSGCAYRTDFDLKNHMEASGIDMTVLREDGTRFIPYVVEPSYGLDRLMYATLENSYERKNKRNIFHLPRNLAPYQVAVFPLVSKDRLPEKAEEVRSMLIQKGFWVTYDEKGSIGRRYARSDEVGTPLAVAIDYKTVEEGILTIRDRDSWTQVSTTINDLPSALEAYFKGEKEFSDLGAPVVRE
ncbi:MAG: glycine--tRNA ligase [Candidatus Bathyarchaeota archaeon]|nr:glycine--tRNA ligase [Candidatus Bathyarchaeota archaeon]